jgi:hypothetical protein
MTQRNVNGSILTEDIVAHIGVVIARCFMICPLHQCVVKQRVLDMCGGFGHHQCDDNDSDIETAITNTTAAATSATACPSIPFVPCTDHGPPDPFPIPRKRKMLTRDPAILRAYESSSYQYSISSIPYGPYQVQLTSFILVPIEISLDTEHHEHAFRQRIGKIQPNTIVYVSQCGCVSSSWNAILLTFQYT